MDRYIVAHTDQSDSGDFREVVTMPNKAILLELFSLSIILGCQPDSPPQTGPATRPFPQNILQLLDTGHFQEAKETAIAARDYYLEKEDSTSTNFATAIDLLGMSYYQLREMQTFAPYFQQAYRIRKKLLPPNHPDVARSINHLAISLYVDSRHDEAIALHQQALHIFAANPQQETMLAQTKIYISLVYKGKGNFFEAKRYAYEALKLLQQQSNISKALLAEAHNHYGRALMELGHYAEAKQEVDIAVNLIHDHYSDIHPLQGRFYKNLARIESYHHLDFEAAAALYEKSIDYYERTVGLYYYELGYVHLGLGRIFREKKEFDLALEEYQMALAIFKRVFAANHSSVLHTRHLIGLAYSRLGDYQTAQSYFQWFLANRGAQFKDNHPAVIANYFELAGLFALQGDRKQAIDYLNIAIRATGFREKSMDGVSPLDWLAKVLFLRGRLLSECYRETNSISDLMDARRDFVAADRAVLNRRLQLVLSQDRKPISREMYPWYEAAIQNNLELFKADPKSIYQEEAFKWIEQNRVFTLYESLREAEATRFFTIQMDSVLKEMQISSLIENLENQKVKVLADSGGL